MRLRAPAILAMTVFSSALLCAQTIEMKGERNRSLARTFDIRQDERREGSRRSAALAVQESRAVEQRRAAAEAFLALPAPARSRRARIVLTKHGLPKSYFKEQGTLSPPSRRDPELIARDFLRDHAAIFPFTALEVEDLRLIRKGGPGGLVVLDFEQTLEGIRLC